MNETATASPDYGNWVPWKLIYVPGILALALLALSLRWRVLLVGVLFFLGCVAYFAYARYQFSSRGRNLEARIRELVLEHLDWSGEGRALDIGCGNGPLATALAKKYPHVQVVGIDVWNGIWDYSRKICERNAALEGVADRVTFQNGSAVSLPFEDESFDAAISNLVFHEVGGVKDKTHLIKEALRVVKKGGKFCFQDQMVGRGKYGKPHELLQEVRGWGVQQAEFFDTRESALVPRLLRNPIMAGNVGIICGTK